jgi:LysM repeat protein
MIKLLFATFLFTADADSLRLETINGKQFIIHQIEAKETLYSISRRYGVQVTAIIESNDQSGGSLAVGQLLKVPYVPKSKNTKPTEPTTVSAMKSANALHIVVAKETLYSIAQQYSLSVDQLKQWNNLTADELKLGQSLIVIQPKYQSTAAPITKTPSEVPAMKGAGAMHTVVAKETLYSISRQYNISVAQLKQWNNLTTDELKLDQQLIVVQPKYSTSAVAVTSTPTNTAPATNVSPTNSSSTTTTIRISEKVMGADEVKEEGNGDLMSGTESSRKYLAFHRTAKIGSVLKVRNQQNNREVFVRVVGPMPADATADLAIRISKAAFNRLEAAEGKFKAEITYYQ